MLTQVRVLPAKHQRYGQHALYRQGEYRMAHNRYEGEQQTGNEKDVDQIVELLLAAQALPEFHAAGL